MKTTLPGPFDPSILLEDLAAGRIDEFQCFPDFGTAHQPHIDLNVRRDPLGPMVKYRMYDTVGAANLLQDFGPDGFSLKKW